MNVDEPLKVHDTLVVKTKRSFGASSVRELIYVEKDDVLATHLRFVPEAYHAALRNCRSGVIQYYTMDYVIPDATVSVVTSVVVTFDGDSWHELVPERERSRPGNADDWMVVWGPEDEPLPTRNEGKW
jgi:hypothetical protein